MSSQTNNYEHPSTQLAEPSIPSTAARLAIFVSCAVLATFALALFPTELSGRSLGHSRFPWLMLFQETLLFASVGLPAWMLARVEHRRSGDYGLPASGLLGKLFWQGAALGLAEISILIGAIALFGGYQFGPVVLRPAEILAWLSFWALFFFVVGLYEEFAFRGYLQFTLTKRIGFWPAAVILSLGFGSIHLMNRNENWVGAASVAVVGLVFAFALRRTGNLWLVVGWHAAFDFGETFLFSVPNSGVLLDGHLSNAVIRGPAWLTGGAVGPEGSVFSFAIMGLAAVFIHAAFPRPQYRT